MSNTRMKCCKQLPHVSPEAKALITKIIEFDKKYPTALEPEMLDFLDIIEFGKMKHPDPPVGARANWLLPDGSTSSHIEMHDRVGHHVARSFADPFGLDAEYPRDHALFAICRLVMIYIRRKRRLVHINDSADYRAEAQGDVLPESKL